MRFPYKPLYPGVPRLDYMPILPIRLELGTRTVDLEALVDSGAVVSVLPYDVGLTFGLNWHVIPTTISLGGGFSGLAKPVRLTATILGFPPVLMGFAWSATNIPRAILGQATFFNQFDVCLYGSRREFEIAPTP